MPRKPAPKPDDPAEYKRFLETAKAAEAEKDHKSFDRAFRKVIKSRAPAAKSGRDSV